MASSLPASEQAYRYVKQLILDGELTSDEMVTEGQIVAQMSISRTPVREAFLRLSSEGWLRLYPKKGALVVPVQPEEMEQVLEARHLIETHAMQAIVRHPEDAKVLGQNLLALTMQMKKSMDEDEDIEIFTSMDTDFHLMIVVSAENDILSNIYRGLRDRLRRMTARSVWHDKERMEGIIRDHTDLAHIVERADVDAFSARLTEHMRSTHERSHRRSDRTTSPRSGSLS
jgi:DNA-binding GntR family transcriptional regulator